MNQKQGLNDHIRIQLRSEKASNPVYVIGNFNDWNESDLSYEMKSVGEHLFELQLPVSEIEFPIKYRYHQGDWKNVELDEFGNLPPKRIIEGPQYEAVDHVPRWMKDGLTYNPDLLPKINVISDDFHIPELNKTRRISALLPYDYDQSDRKYPVLYLQDGQNLADENAPFGNWAVDKKLAVLKELGLGDIIVVAIDHGGKDRIKEYQPFKVKSWEKGDGKRYADFIVNTLKPYIDENFRTMRDRENNGIGGSSMGGLISIYAGLMFPEVFSKLMIFSPSLWASPRIFQNALDFGHEEGTRVYLYGGAKESDDMVKDIQRFKKWLLKSRSTGKSPEVKVAVNELGEHNESYWGKEFPFALKWLFSQN